MRNLDALMSSVVGTLLPSWRDTIVGNMGGAGFVHLLPHDGHLLQRDLYLCPTSAVGALRRRIVPRLLWQGPGADDLAGADVQRRTAQELARATQTPVDCGHLLVQAMVLHAMLRKCLARGRQYIAYGLLHDLNATCRDVIRTALVPHSRHQAN
ncbi:hypothetical protein ACFRDV_23915 [Streptomyces fagopyri]|uniref:hypothetical protein n=1 Tax=Streptomyces fagopyri TaxID=2662397 RepID=UPI0036C45F07